MSVDFSEHYSRSPVRLLGTNRHPLAGGCWLIGLGMLLFATHAWALNIMLVNDDGCNAPGINVLADALESAGYTVTMYAPADNQSGQGSRIAIPNRKYSVLYKVSNKDLSGQNTSDPSRHCVSAKVVPRQPGTEGELPPPYTSAPQTLSASPVDSVRIGLALLENEPDLVISGINPGNNIAVTAFSSGTISAALRAITQGVPAIAISINRSSARSGGFERAAAFMVDLVDRLKAKVDGRPLLPDGIGLNINFPKGDPKGIVYSRPGHTALFKLGIEKVEGKENVFRSTFIFPRPPEKNIPKDEIEQEGVALRQGYVSITTLRVSLAASQAAEDLIRLKLHGVKP